MFAHVHPLVIWGFRPSLFAVLLFRKPSSRQPSEKCVIKIKQNQTEFKGGGVGSHLLVHVLQGLVQLLQPVQVELLLQLLRLAQVLQHLLGEAVWEAGADLLDHRALQPHLALAQQPVAEVIPAEGRVSDQLIC